MNGTCHGSARGNRGSLRGKFPRCHYNSSHKAKVQYASEKEALESVKAKYRGTYTAYQCPVCSMWHLSHIRKKQEPV